MAIVKVSYLLKQDYFVLIFNVIKFFGIIVIKYFNGVIDYDCFFEVL